MPAGGGVFPTPGTSPFLPPNTDIQNKISVGQMQHFELSTQHWTFHSSPTLTFLFPSRHWTFPQISNRRPTLRPSLRGPPVCLPKYIPTAGAFLCHVAPSPWYTPLTPCRLAMTYPAWNTFLYWGVPPVLARSISTCIWVLNCNVWKWQVQVEWTIPFLYLYCLEYSR